MRQCAGTPEFISPEASSGRYDAQTDLWSCGVSMYVLLCGYTPFFGDTEAGVFAAVRRGNFSFASSEWSNITDNAKDLLRLLLKMNPRERCTAEEALNHLWLGQRAPGASGTLQKTVSNLRAKSVRKKCKQSEANAFTDVRGVLSDVTQWANSLLPDTLLWKEDDPKAQCYGRKPNQKSYWI